MCISRQTIDCFLEESKLYATVAVLVLLSSDPLQDELEFHFTLKA